MALPLLYDICVPRRDVLDGTTTEAEFAADLAAVLRGTAPREYGDAAPGVPPFQDNRHRRTPAARIEPAASLPGGARPIGVAAGAPDGLMHLLQKGLQARPARPFRPDADWSHTDGRNVRSASGLDDDGSADSAPFTCQSRVQ